MSKASKRARAYRAQVAAQSKVLADPACRELLKAILLQAGGGVFWLPQEADLEDAPGYRLTPAGLRAARELLAQEVLQ